MINYYVGIKSITQLMFCWMCIMGQRDYMFRPVVAIIRSLSFDTFNSTLYNCVVACLMWRSWHQAPPSHHRTPRSLYAKSRLVLDLWLPHLHWYYFDYTFRLI